MGVKLVSSGSGSVEINPPATASNFVTTMPAASGNVVLDSAAQTLTNKAWSSPAGSTISSGTVQNSTSGTSIDFTGIPSWVKRITVMLNGVSTSGTSNFLIQLGDSGGVENTGYASLGYQVNTTPTGTSTTSTAGYAIMASASAAGSYTGIFTICLISSNTWVLSGTGTRQDSGTLFSGSGSKTLSDVLDRVRITTIGGTDTFDAGSINILYE